MAHGVQVKVAARAEQRGKLFLLLLPAELPQALAHRSAAPAASAAELADGLALQILRVDILGLQNPVPLALERQIFLPERLHRLLGALASPEGGGVDLRTRFAKLAVNFAQTR